MSSFTATDHLLMARALRLAERAAWTTRPNPMVGCVIAHGEEVLGEGWHQRAGGPHAEVFALRMAGERARGATAYVTLEPCAHYGRTPPCALALIEAESELSVLDRQVSHGGFWIEANDLSAVQLCREKGRPFVAGPSLNVYNHRALAMLAEDGLRRWVPGVEQGRALIGELADACIAGGGAMPELEVTAWGRLPLSYSARCFTARALDVPKDQCGFRCIEHPDGMPLATREGRPFLRINGISVQGEEITDLGPELPELRALGVDILRLYPQAAGMEAVVRHFDAARASVVAPARIGQRNGYWHGEPGMRTTA